MSHRNYGEACCRCGSTMLLQYDNTLDGSMCMRCWDTFTKCHEECHGCGESVLMPEKETLWTKVGDVNCLSGLLGARAGDKIYCDECENVKDQI